ncbi:MAG TPA: glycosyltransferase family 4 protein, partial [Acidimicrobiales bacterium]|nr:glycosyltransferase family 4 protein [Acidimicrobiales bacterium]
MTAGARPLRVAHLTTSDISLRYLLMPQLLAGVERGWEMTGISAPGPDADHLPSRGVRHIALRSSTRAQSIRSDIRAARELWKVLRAERFDVLHTHNPKTGLYGRIVGRLAGVPVVVHTTHGLYASPDDPWPKRLLVYALEAIASRFADADLVQNPEDLALMRRLRLVPRGRAHLLGNGIDVRRFDPAAFTPAQRVAIRAAMGIGPEQVVVGAVGRLVAEKGFAEIFQALPAFGDNVTLVVAGPGDDAKADSLPADAMARARASGVHFLGMRTDVEAVYASMDIFVLASYREGYPRAAMEAAAMALPIVATDIRGCREVVRHGENGFLVPVRDPGALAGAVRQLVEDHELRAEMGAAGRARA